MVKQGLIAGLILSAVVVASQASAEVCDYRLSQLIGGGGAATAIGSAGGVAAGGAAFHAAGLYIIVHSTSGLTMLASTAAGASAAGTVGILSGTAGALGTVGAIVSAPVTMLAAGGAALGAGAVEIGCYFGDDRITEYEDVLRVVRLAAGAMPQEVFQLFELSRPERSAYIRVDMGGVTRERFDVDNLYIVNGRLIHRDWGPNTVILDITARE